MQSSKQELWRTRLDLPAYRVGEVASYAKISPSTVTSWERSYDSRPSVVSRRAPREGLSFLQLIEVAVVSAMRQEGVKLSSIRAARDFFSWHLDTDYPFAKARFKTDGVDILLDHEEMDGTVSTEKLLIAKSEGQFLWTGAIQRRLKEFNYGDRGAVEAWKVAGEASNVIIDPRISFGAPTVSGIKTLVLKNAYVTGAPVAEICEDYDLESDEVIAALRFEGIEIQRPVAA